MILHKYNENGEWVPSEDILLTPDENGDISIPDGYTDLEIPVPNWKPILKDGAWIESITDEEKNALLNPPKVETVIDVLKKQNEDLNLQIIDLWETLISGGVL